VLAGYGWDGAVAPSGQDFLLVVDSNVGGNKANALVAESIDYRIDLAASEPAAELTLHYAHAAPAQADGCLPTAQASPLYDDWTKGCYWDFVRVYVPAGSRLQGGTVPTIPAEQMWNRQPAGGTPAVEAEAGDGMAWSAPLLLPPGEERTLSFTYALPGAVLRQEGEGWAYRLRVQKQPGTSGHPLRVTVVLPHGSTALSCSPGPCRGGPEYAFDLDLQQDREVVIVFERP
jgi:hypothetical protein